VIPFDRSFVGWTALLGIGFILSVTYVTVFVFVREPLVAGIAVPALMAFTVIGITLWLWQHDPTDDRIYRLGLWCATITLFAAALGVVNIYTELLVAGDIRSNMLMLANSATIGAILGILIGFYDADRQQKHRQVQQQQAQIKCLSERLTVLNRVLRHDIRNDVNLIAGYAKMGKQGEQAPDQALSFIQEKANEIEAVSHRAREIEELITENNPTDTIDLVAIVREEIAELQNGYPDELDITLTLPDEAIVSGNPLLQSAVDNLLENAVEHTDQSPVELDVSVTTTDDGVELTIVDNGPGVPDHEQAVLEGNAESALQQSDGMGLWLIHWIVEEFDGTITTETSDGGTSVQLRLPRAQTSAEPTDWQTAAATQSRGAASR
jgi:signal transduction histidine kinase